MTDPEAEYGDRLRRALHTAADGIAVSRDAHDRIRSRIAAEPAYGSLSSLLSWVNTPAGMQLWLRDGKLWLSDNWLRLREGVARPAWHWMLAEWRHSIRPWLRNGPPARVRGWFRDGDGWMRPVLATAGAVLIAAITVLAIPGLRQDIMEAGSVGPSTSPSAPGTPAGIIPGLPRQTSGNTVPVTPRRSTGPKPTPSHHRGTAPPTSCPTPAGSATAPPGLTGSPGQASTVPCTTPTPTTSPTPTPSVSPSPSPSGTPPALPGSATGGPSGNHPD